MVSKKLTQDFQSGHLAHSYIIAGEAINNLLDITNNFIKTSILKESNRILENSPDYLILKKEIINGKEQKYISVSQARSAIEFFSKTAWENQSKVLVIYQAENMNDNCANALLKLLEDTPKYCYIFLLTSNINKILPTIRSRSRIIYENHNDTNQKTTNQYLNLLTSDSQKDVEKFLKTTDGENGKIIWKEFTRELDLGLHNILLSYTQHEYPLSTQEEELKNVITFKSIDSLIKLHKKINFLTQSSIKYDLSKNHIFYLIQQMIRQ